MKTCPCERPGCERPGCERPGGLELTCHLLSRHPLEKGAHLLDVGCGEGATVGFLRETRGLLAVGIDIAPVTENAYIFKGDAIRLPFPDASKDALLFECSLSCMAEPRAAFMEARRILKKDGVIFLSDVYQKAGAQLPTRLAERCLTLEAQLEFFQEMGFHATSLHTHNELLSSYWASRLFAHGPEAALDIFGPHGPQGLAIASLGYYSLLLRRGDAAPITIRENKNPCESRPSTLQAWVHSSLGLGEDCTNAELRRWQMERAAQTIARAKSNSPFYRRHLSAVDGGALIREQTLASVPFTNEVMLAQYGEQMLSLGLGEVARVRTFPTSGSTGPAKRVWFSEADMERTIDFFAHGMRHIVPLGKRVAIMLSEDKPGSIADLLREGLRRMGMQSQIYGRPAKLEEACAVARNAFLVGMPGDMLYICRKSPRLPVAGVLLSGDYIPPPVVQALEASWECPVFCHYGLTETCYGLAVQCGAQQASLAQFSQHIRLADYFIEIIDPLTQKVLPTGQAGEIVLTSLQEKALPLIRYRTGDMGSLQEEPCGCGCGLPHLGTVGGRLSNLREPVNIHRLDDILYEIPGVAGYHALRAGKGLSIKIDGAPVAAGELAARLGCPVKVEYGDAAPWNPCELLYKSPGWRPGKRQLYQIE